MRGIRKRTTAGGTRRVMLAGLCLALLGMAAAFASPAERAQQGDSANQGEGSLGIQHESQLVDNQYVAVERFTYPPRNEGFGLSSGGSQKAEVLALEFRHPGAGAQADEWKFASAGYFELKGKPVTIVGPSASPFRLVNVFLNDLPDKAPFADDAVKLDPKHNQILFENKRVRVVRVHFGPGESGPMVDKRARVIIMLTDSHATVTLPDGHSEVRDGKAGRVAFSKGGRQATNNVGTTELENIVVELKGK